MALEQELKVPQTDKRGHLLVQQAQIDRIERRVDHEPRDQQDQRQAKKKPDRGFPLSEFPHGASSPRGPSGCHYTDRNARAVCHSLYLPKPILVETNRSLPARL